MARPKGKMSFTTPTGRKSEITAAEALEKYGKIRQGSLKGSTRTRQLVEEGRRYEEEHARGPRGGRGMQSGEE